MFRHVGRAHHVFDGAVARFLRAEIEALAGRLWGIKPAGPDPLTDRCGRQAKLAADRFGRPAKQQAETDRACLAGAARAEARPGPLAWPGRAGGTGRRRWGGVFRIIFHARQDRMQESRSDWPQAIGRRQAGCSRAAPRIGSSPSPLRRDGLTRGTQRRR